MNGCGRIGVGREKFARRKAAELKRQRKKGWALFAQGPQALNVPTPEAQSN